MTRQRANISLVQGLLVLSICCSLARGQVVCENTQSFCAAGCWNPGDVILENNHHLCVPVTPGYFSLANSNEREECPPGHVSTEDGAAFCDACPPGSFGDTIRRDTCHLCFVGFWQSSYAGSSCQGPCDPARYGGLGSTGRSLDGFCYKESESPSGAPSTEPSTQPSAQPSAAPSDEPSAEPSIEPTATPSIQPSAEPSIQPSAEPSAQPSSFPSAVPTLVPSRAPSTSPSALPSLTPSVEPSEMPTVEPSTFPSLEPSIEPTVYTDDEFVSTPLGSEGTCADNEQISHGVCSKCPSNVGRILYPIITVILFAAIFGFFHFMAPHGTAVVFILFDYMQRLALIGTTYAPWPAVMKVLFTAGDLFNLDPDVFFPPQCIFGTTPQASRAIQLSIPLLLFAGRTTSIVCTCRGDFKSPQFKEAIGMTMISLYLSFQILLDASWQAIKCSPVQYDEDGDNVVDTDWFCSANGSAGDKAAAALGLFGFLLYGIAFPIVLGFVLLNRYRERVQTERVHGANTCSTQNDPENEVQVLRQRGEDSEVNPLKSLLAPFILMFVDDKWNWAIGTLAWRFLSVCVVAVTGDNPVVGQVFLVVFGVININVTMKVSPYWQDSEGDMEGQSEAKRSFSFWNHVTLDCVLLGIEVVILIIGVLMHFLDPMSDTHLGLGLLGVALMSIGIVYVVAMACKLVKERMDEDETSVGDDNIDDGVSSIVVTNRRRTAQVEKAEVKEAEVVHVGVRVDPKVEHQGDDKVEDLLGPV